MGEVCDVVQRPAAYLQSYLWLVSLRISSSFHISGAIAMEAGGELSINGHVDFVNNSAFSNGGEHRHV